MMNAPMDRYYQPRKFDVGAGRWVQTTPVFDSYWRFAAARQDAFVKRVAGAPAPWVTDPIIAAHRFTNAYRASDRVSQYLIRHVIYEGSTKAEEVFFRVLLFKLFNRIDTWELLSAQLGDRPSWKSFDVERYSRILDRAMNENVRLYSAAYIMPSPPFGSPRKHRNHLELLDRMMRDKAPVRIAKATSLDAVYNQLLSYPSLGGFLAFQFAIDLNYSELIDFSEMAFVVAGPGAKNGIQKCFANVQDVPEAAIIRLMSEVAEAEFARLGLCFHKLGGTRPLQLIDCQNLFCETDKYARVAHPEITGGSGRTRIKQKFAPNTAPLPQFYPPKWGINAPLASARSAPTRGARPTRQLDLSLEVTAAE